MNKNQGILSRQITTTSRRKNLQLNSSGEFAKPKSLFCFKKDPKRLQSLTPTARNSSLRAKLDALNSARLEITNRLQSRKVKETQTAELEQKYNVKFTFYQKAALSIEELIRKAKAIEEKRKQTRAALKISNWWKRARVMILLKKEQALMHSSAKVIQKAWKAYYKRKLEKLELKEKLLAVLKCQKLVRGFLARRKVAFENSKAILDKNYKYFTEIRENLEEEAARTISKHWKSYKREKTMRIRRKQLKTILMIGGFSSKKSISRMQPHKGTQKYNRANTAEENHNLNSPTNTNCECHGIQNCPKNWYKIHSEPASPYIHNQSAKRKSYQIPSHLEVIQESN